MKHKRQERLYAASALVTSTGLLAMELASIACDSQRARDQLESVEGDMARLRELFGKGR